MKKIIIALICLIIFSCTNEKISTGVGDFVFSADDKYIYFNFFNGISSSIYRVDSSGNNVKILIPAINDISFYRLRFFNDNQNFVLIGGEPYSNKAGIFKSDLKTLSVKRLTGSESIITEAFPSRYSNSIIFCKSDTLAQNSPIAKASNRGSDIYSLNLDNNQIIRISKLDAYLLANVSELNKDLFVVHYFDKDHGMYIFTRNEPSKLLKICAKNESDETRNHYYDILFSEKYNCFVFSNGYGLSLMDGKRYVKTIYNLPDGKISSFCLFNTCPRVLFTVDGDKNFYSINFDGTDIKTIKINLPNRKD